MISFLCKRGIILYVVIALLTYFFIDTSEAIHMARLKTLNRLRPSDGYISQLVDQQEVVDKEKLKNYIYYYKKITEYVENSADAYGMLGFCNYKLGNKKRAKAYFHKAVTINPNFFWYHYNLGLIYFREDEYEHAIGSLRNAINTPTEITMGYLHTSRVYLPIIMGSDVQFGNELLKRIYADHTNSFILLIQIHHKQKDYKEILAVANFAIKLGLDKNGDFAYYAGLAALEEKEFGAALLYFQQAISHNKYHTDAYMQVANVLQKLGKGEAAVPFIQRAVILKTTKGSVLPKMEQFELKIF